MGRRVVLEDHKAKLAERGIDVEAGGQTFHIDPPQLWSDEALRLQESGDSDGLLVEVIGGQARYEEFAAAGGSKPILDSIIGLGFEATVPE